MFKIKYNILVALQIIFGILNTVLLINVFGVSKEADAYLLSISILGILQVILLMPVFQFLPFYCDYKHKSITKSQDFYNFLILFSIIFGIIFCSIALLCSNLLIKLVVLNIDSERLLILKQLLSISLFGSAFYTVIELNTQLLNAEEKYSIPYIFSIIPTACTVFAQTYLVYSHNHNVYLLAYVQAISTFLVALCGILYINNKLIKFKFIKKFDNILAFLKNSASMQIGNSIYWVTTPTIINNFLVTLPQGFVSYFYYAKKTIDIVNNFTTGPSARILRSKIAKLFAKKNALAIKKDSNHFVLLSTTLMIIVCFVAYFLQVPILKIISNNKLTQIDLHYIQKTFLSLVFWYTLILIESPYSLINATAKNSSIFIITNSICVGLFSLFIFIMPNCVGIYTIGIAAFFSQIFNYVRYRNCALKMLNKL